MDKKSYKVLNEFRCCGVTMVTVIMKGAACVMPESDYNRIMEDERKYKKSQFWVGVA